MIIRDTNRLLMEVSLPPRVADDSTDHAGAVTRAKPGRCDPARHRRPDEARITKIVRKP